MQYNEAVEYVLGIPKFAKKIGTDNLIKFLGYYDNPHLKLNTIHVAGTNGKGSVCAYMESLLRKKGFKVGVFTSPHLVCINERMRIDGVDISDDKFAYYVSDIIEQSKKLEKLGIPHPSFFELLFIIAVKWFNDENLDYCIFETGMGGRLDATNVLLPKVSIITSVGMDHMEYLGDTIEKIASEKAGVIKSNIPVVYFKRDRIASRIIEDKAKIAESDVYRVENSNYIIDEITDDTIDFSFDNMYYSYKSLKIQKTGLYQIENAIVAIVATNLVLGITIDDVTVRQALMSTYWPGRMEQILPNVFLDGAHNDEAINVICNSITTLYPDYTKNLLFAVANDKDYDNMIKDLSCIKFSRIYVTAIYGSRATSVSVVADLFKKYCYKSQVLIVEDCNDAFIEAVDEQRKNPDEQLYCLGSLYLVGSLKERLLRRKYDDKL